MASELEFLDPTPVVKVPTVEKLTFERGDVAVLRLPKTAPMSVRVKLAEELRAKLPEGVLVTVADEEITLEKMRDEMAAKLKAEVAELHEQVGQLRTDRDRVQRSVDDLVSLVSDLEHLTHRNETVTLKTGQRVTIHSPTCEGCKRMSTDEWVERLERALGRRA